jgi:hypothetical protein
MPTMSRVEKVAHRLEVIGEFLGVFGQGRGLRCHLAVV